MKHSKLLLTSAIALGLTACGDGDKNNTTHTPQTAAQKDRMATVVEGKAGQRTNVTGGGVFFSGDLDDATVGANVRSQGGSTTSVSAEPQQGSAQAQAPTPAPLTLEQRAQGMFDAAWKITLKYNIPQIERRGLEIEKELRNDASPPTPERIAELQKEGESLFPREQMTRMSEEVRMAVSPFFEEEFVTIINQRRDAYEKFDITVDLTAPSNPKRPWDDIILIRKSIAALEPDNISDEVRSKAQSIERMIDYLPLEQKRFTHFMLEEASREWKEAFHSYTTRVQAISEEGSTKPKRLHNLKVKLSEATDEHIDRIRSNKPYWESFATAFKPQIDTRFVHDGRVESLESKLHHLASIVAIRKLHEISHPRLQGSPPPPHRTCKF